MEYRSHYSAGAVVTGNYCESSGNLEGAVFLEHVKVKQMLWMKNGTKHASVCYYFVVATLVIFRGGLLRHSPCDRQYFCTRIGTQTTLIGASILAAVLMAGAASKAKPGGIRRANRLARIYVLYFVTARDTSPVIQCASFNGSGRNRCIHIIALAARAGWVRQRYGSMRLVSDLFKT